jgi:hypothetical protein
MIGDKFVILTTGSMNRLDSLRRSLVTWLALREVDEILIVDWGSQAPLREALADFRFENRVTIVRTDQKHWHNSKCHNLELSLVSEGALWLRLDNDTLIQPDFFAKHPHQDNSFYAVNWRKVPKEQDDKRNLAGTLFVDPKLVRTVQGYNERLLHYGSEDDDLHARLVASGLRWLDVDLNTIEHIPHGDNVRYENLAIANDLPKLAAPYKNNKGFCWNDQLTCDNAERSVLLALSQSITAEHPWTVNDRMTEWRLSRRKPGCDCQCGGYCEVEEVVK